MTASRQRRSTSIARTNAVGLLSRSLLLSISCLVAVSAHADPAPPVGGANFVEASDSVTVAECEHLGSSANDAVEGLLSTFYENGIYRFAVTHVAFTRFPSGFFTDDAAHVVFRVWTQSAAGARVLRPNPARLFLYERTRGLILRNAPLDRISRSGIEAALALSRLDPAAYPLDTALVMFSVLLSGIDETWDGVTVEGYTAASGTVPAFAIDAAIPPYATDAGARSAELCRVFDRTVHHQRVGYREVDRPYLRLRPAAVQVHP